MYLVKHIGVSVYLLPENRGPVDRVPIDVGDVVVSLSSVVGVSPSVLRCCEGLSIPIDARTDT